MAEQNPQIFDIDAVRAELMEKGWAVVPNVVDGASCDRWRHELDDWLTTFGEDQFPRNINSIIHGYNIGHISAMWEARVRVKPLFAQIWNTEKLLTSVDGLAIGQPPENGWEKFEAHKNEGLHCDQKSARRGLHAYQGALYVEEQLADDWCFKVISYSHKKHAEYFAQLGRTPKSEFHKLTDSDVEWYEDNGCCVERVPVPKGGFMLWDSRLIHAGARPRRGRANPGRGRYVLFICQAPAIWASPQDLMIKRSGYESLKLTRHWPAQGVSNFDRRGRGSAQDITELPPSAKTVEAKQLAGVEPYNFSDGRSNGPKAQPKWKH